MKICFLAGANSIHSVRWIKYFSDKGHKIIWISLAPPIPEAADLIKKVSFYEIKPSPLNDINGHWAIFYLPSAIRQFKKILKTAKPDLLHVHSVGTYGLISFFGCFHPIILTPWGSDILLFPKNILRKKILKFILKKADAFTIDGLNARKVLEDFGAPKEKIFFIQFGVDIKKFFPEKKPSANAVISLRNLEPIYDIATLIKAVPIIMSKIPNTEFLVAGDGSEKQKLIELSERLGVSNYVKFIGKITHDDLPEIFNESILYVSTSLSDSGLSMSTAEAMASGLPVVVSDSSDNKEWIKNNENGFIVPIKNSEALAEKIIFLLKNPDLAKQMGKNNQKLIEEKNNYCLEMEKAEKLYRKMISKKLI